MLNDIITETNITYAAQSRLFINVNIENETRHSDNNYYPEFISFVRSDVAVFRNAQYVRQDRF